MKSKRLLTELSLNTTLKYISHGIKNNLENKIRDELNKVAKPIIDDIAKKLAEDLHTKLVAYYETERDQFVVQIKMDEVKNG